MGNTDTKLKGPDLTLGVDIAELTDGVPLAGHAHGEPVLLVRRGAEVFAVGSVCTHYSGPLADGIVVGEEIRCPWHHACFSLRTGQVIAAPALNPLPTWSVALRDGKVFVEARTTVPATRSARVDTSVRRVAIVGGGAAGSAAAETLRSEGFEGDLTILDPDTDAPYDRPNLSKDYLAGTAPEEWLPLRAPDFEASLGIRRVADSARSIDVSRGEVTVSAGKVIPFDGLIIATGATPIRPAVPGAELPHVHVLRTLRDCRALIASLEGARRVVIAGASFIGMEAAAALRNRGVDVVVVAPEWTPFERVFGLEIGASLKRLHEQNGVTFIPGRMLSRIEEGRVVLDDGSDVSADRVLLGIGVRPQLDVAHAAGLEIRNGLVVDDHLETAARCVFAAGDIARYPDARTGADMRIEHWVVAQRQGACAARNLLGARERYRSVPFFWTRQYDVTVSYVGHAAEWTHVNFNGSADERNCAAAFMDGDRLAAYVTIGRDIDSLDAEWGLENWER